jgi:hypothetical protein
MENDEEPLVFAARTAYEFYRRNSGLIPVILRSHWPDWDKLPNAEKTFWEAMWAKAHEAYWNQRQLLENGSLRGGVRE